MWPMILFVKRFKANFNDPVYLSLFAVLILLVLEFSKSYDFYAGISLVVVSVLSMKHLEQKTGFFTEGNEGKEGVRV
ncbi:MAG: hypothetical protein U5R49_06080 [Deltaproteobacteria bacterium]|nr:hypothetical protein [Deltaproteobacteria bacterium]